MAETVGQVNAASGGDTWATLVARVNLLANVATSRALTVDSTSGGAKVTGNSFVYGILGANTVTVKTGLRGGNVGSSANLTLVSNLVVTDSTVVVSVGNLTLNTSSLALGSNVVLDATRLALGNSSVNTVVNSTALSVAGGSVVANSTVVAAPEANAALVSLSGNVAKLAAVTGSTTTTTADQVVDYFALAAGRVAEYVLSVKSNSTNAYQATKVLVVQADGVALATEYAVLTSNGVLATFSATVNSTACALTTSPAVAGLTIKGSRTVVGV